MNQKSVFIVNADPDDFEIVQDVWKELDFLNPLKYFASGEEVLSYLEKEQEPPFIIIADVNLSAIDGFELRKRIIEDDSLKYKGIPFIFWSTTASKAQIQRAYDLSVHGFFIKDSGFEELKQSFIDIMNYWVKSKRPL